MKYICSWSGGKDSTASIILAHENNEPLDTIIFSEVMFKKGKSGENPKHIDFVMNKAKPLFESWGYEVIILRSNKTYLDIFNHVIEKPRKHMSHKGQKYGFAVTGLCSVKRDLKLKPIADYYKSLGTEPYVQYVGIRIDEPKRLISLHKDDSKISLLEKYRYTKDMVKTLCEKYDLLSPTYELSENGGCWFCPYAKLEEHRQIKELDPEMWKEFVNLENEPNLANNKWNVYGETLKERDAALNKKEDNMEITKESILGVGGDTSLVGLDWLREHTPYTKDGKAKLIDCVEFEISHKGIEKLERNIHDETEYVMCFVHLEAGTENLDGIYMSIWNEDADIDEPIDTNILTDDEKKTIIDYALAEVKKER